MRIPARLPLLMLLACLLLAGCARETARLPTDWQSHVASLEERKAWDLQGKIGLRSASDAGSALLSWRQREADYRLVLSGALGLGKLVLDGSADGVSWIGRDGRPRSHSNPEALIRELWGWQVPVTSLSFWVRGLPDPAHQFVAPQFEGGLATRFEQAGWIVEPQAFRPVDGIALPTRVRLQGQGAVLTVSISRWSFATP